jgi:hypothetical protein
MVKRTSAGIVARVRERMDGVPLDRKDANPPGSGAAFLAACDEIRAEISKIPGAQEALRAWIGPCPHGRSPVTRCDEDECDQGEP